MFTLKQPVRRTVRIAAAGAATSLALGGAAVSDASIIDTATINSITAAPSLYNMSTAGGTATTAQVLDYLNPVSDGGGGFRYLTQKSSDGGTTAVNLLQFVQIDRSGLGQGITAATTLSWSDGTTAGGTTGTSTHGGYSQQSPHSFLYYAPILPGQNLEMTGIFLAANGSHLRVWVASTIDNGSGSIGANATSPVVSQAYGTGWQIGDATFTNNGSSTEYVHFLMQDPYGAGGNGFEQMATLVDRTPVVPEPASLALLGMGALSLVARRRR